MLGTSRKFNERSFMAYQLCFMLVQLTPLILGRGFTLSLIKDLKHQIYWSVLKWAYYLFCLTGSCVSSIVTGGRVSGLPWIIPLKFDIKSEFNRPSATSCCINTSNCGLPEHPSLCLCFPKHPPLRLCFPKCCSKKYWLNFSLKMYFPGFSLIRACTRSMNDFTKRKVRISKIRRLLYK